MDVGNNDDLGLTEKERKHFATKRGGILRERTYGNKPSPFYCSKTKCMLAFSHRLNNFPSFRPFHP